MPGPLLQIEGTVLLRTSGAGAFDTLTIFCPSHELLQVRLRRSARTGPSVAVDLFDEVHASLSSPADGRTWFVRELSVLRRARGLGRSYGSLQAAVRFARVLLLNPMHEESRPAVHALLRRALDAWEAGVHPEVVYFKTLYTFARDEGYPVREAWLAGLSEQERADALLLLGAPLAKLPSGAPDGSRLAASLEAWLAGHVEMRFG